MRAPRLTTNHPEVAQRAFGSALPSQTSLSKQIRIWGSTGPRRKPAKSILESPSAPHVASPAS